MQTTTQKTFSKAEQIKAIDRAWLFICEELDDVNHSKHGTKLYKLNEREERDYRRNDDRPRWGITIAFSARLLSLQWLLKYLENKDLFTVQDIIHSKVSCAYAASLAANYPQRIQAALLESKADREAIEAANYVQLVK